MTPQFTSALDSDEWSASAAFGTYWRADCVDPKGSLESCGEGKKLATLLGIEPRPLSL
jgi:hypothetical protein